MLVTKKDKDKKKERKIRKNETGERKGRTNIER